jgi:hypothetical protein
MRFRYSSFHKVKFIYLAALLMALHHAFTVYINSTYLSQFFSSKTVSLLYTSGAVLTIILFIASTSIVRRIKNFNFFIGIVFIEIMALLGLYATSDPLLLKIFFIVHQAIPPLLLFGLDIFLEGVMRNNERKTGGVHSLYLTAQSVAFVFSPFIVGKIVNVSSYTTVYLLSAFFCVLLLFVAFDELRNIRTRKLHEVNFIDSVEKFIPHKNLNRVFIVNFLLHSFYVCMIIYMPLYLHDYIGFEWETIGFIFTIMLLPFVIFESPLGRMLDRVHLEKDTIITGFIIMSIASLAIYFTNSNSVFVWAALLFISRVGASFVEVGAEFAFFKRVSDQDAGFISIFRMATPAAFIVTPLLTSTLIQLQLPIRYIFLALSIAILMGIAFAYKLNTVRS